MAGRRSAPRPPCDVRAARRLGRARSRQDGAFAIMFVPLLVMMVGFCGLALDMGQIYNRQVDMHGLAKAVALAAARELDGTAEGILEARAKAREVAGQLRFHHFGRGESFTWDEAALSFGPTASRSDTWVPASGAEIGTTARTLFFARVETARLGRAASAVSTPFIDFFVPDRHRLMVSEDVIAGRTSVRVTPIAICAMSPDAATGRTVGAAGSTVKELVQHGFRRGISYDLMKLNPHGTSPRRFVIDPLGDPGAAGGSASIAATAPFVCSGTIWAQRMAGSTVRVTALPDTAPLAGLSAPLNTRFDVYTGTPCNANGAPPDVNVKPFTYDVDKAVKWISSPTKGSPAAVSTQEGGKLRTVADLDTAPAAPGDYGPLWAFAKAAIAPASPGAEEPAEGYATFTPEDWPTLYPSGPTTTTYPSSDPYIPYFFGTSASGYYTAPRVANRPVAAPFRRVLNIPLLACTASDPSGANAEATVLAVGKFFMTVQATDNTLIAEFAGLLPRKSVPGQVEIYP